MIAAHVRPDGSIVLGDAAERLGFRRGAVVQISVTSAGSLLVVLDDTPALDVALRSLPRTAGRSALRGPQP